MMGGETQQIQDLTDDQKNELLDYYNKLEI